MDNISSYIQPSSRIHLVLETQLSTTLSSHQRVSNSTIEYLPVIYQVRQHHSSDIAPPIVPLQKNPYHPFTLSHSHPLDWSERANHPRYLVHPTPSNYELWWVNPSPHVLEKNSRPCAAAPPPPQYGNIRGIHGPLVT